MSKPAPIDGLESSSRLSDAARRTIERRLADVRRLEAAVAEGSAPDAVHDMRVASRRLRAALTLFERKKQLRAAHDAVKALGDALGEVRELHVQLGWLDEALGRADERQRRGVQVLRDERAAKLPKRLGRLGEALVRWRDEGVAAVEAALAAYQAGGRLGGHRVRQRIARRLQKTRKRAAETLASPDAHTAHRLRIAAKKLRYVAELAQPAFPDEMTALIDRLQPLQSELGQLHDADVHLALVEKFLVRADGEAQPGALMVLRGELARREERAAAVADALERLRHDRVLEELRDALC